MDPGLTFVLLSHIISCLHPWITCTQPESTLVHGMFKGGRYRGNIGREMKRGMTEGRTWWLWRKGFEVGVAYNLAITTLLDELGAHSCKEERSRHRQLSFVRSACVLGKTSSKLAAGTQIYAMLC